MKETKKFEDAAYNFIAELSSLAAAACEERDINRVHWFVSEIRRIDRLIRAVKLRLDHK